MIIIDTIKKKAVLEFCSYLGGLNPGIVVGKQHNHSRLFAQVKGFGKKAGLKITNKDIERIKLWADSKNGSKKAIGTSA